MKKLLLSLTLLLASCAFVPAKSDFAAIVNVYSGDNPGCTATVIDAPKAIYLTAKHCWTQTGGVLNLQNKTKMTLVALDEAADLALIQGGIAREELKVSQFTPQPEDELSAVGYAGNTPQLRYRLYMISPSLILEPEQTLVPDAIYQGEILAGTSGAPILNKRNEIVGVVSGVYRRVGSVTWGATLDQIHEFLHRVLGK